MTTRIKGLIVALDHDIREDDVESLMEAIRHLRSVLTVAPIEATSEDWIVDQRVRSELRQKLFDALKE